MPLIGQVFKRGWRLTRVQHLKRVGENSALHIAVPLTTEGVTHRMVQKDRTRRFYLFGEIACGRYQHGRNTECFDDPRDQTHGLVIKGSSRDGDEGVYIIGGQHLRELRCLHLQNLRASVDSPHESAVVT